MSGSQLHPSHHLTSSTGWKHHRFYASYCTPDKFSLLYKKIILDATLVKAFRQLYSSLTWAGKHNIITPGACARGKVMGCVVVIIVKIAISRDVGI